MQNKILGNIPQNLTDEQQAQARSNIGLGSRDAGQFVEDRDYYAGDLVTRLGRTYAFIARHTPGAFDDSVVVPASVAHRLYVSCGRLADDDVVVVPRNNSVSSLVTSRGQVTFVIVVSLDDPVPNFVVQVVNSVTCTVYIQIMYDMGEGSPAVGGYAAYSADAGKELDACGSGEANILSCVGGSWTWRKVLDGTPPQQNVSAVQTQGVQSVGLPDFVVGGSLAAG